MWAPLHAVGPFDPGAWRLYPSFLSGWLLVLGLYLWAVGPGRRLVPGSAPVPGRQVASFLAGMGLLLVALQGPLHDLSDTYLFSAHMLQHLLVTLPAPPLLLYGTPQWLARPLLRIPVVGGALRRLTHPLVAFLLNHAVWAFWHVPGPYDLMMRHHDVHVVVHLLILATGLLLWWPVAGPLPDLRRLSLPLQMVYLFVAGIPMMLVAAFITLSESVLYPWYQLAPRTFGLDPLDDQRLGGVLMWVPGTLALWVGIAVLFARWLREERRFDRAAPGSLAAAA
jgi:putative membrane protein